MASTGRRRQRKFAVGARSGHRRRDCDHPHCRAGALLRRPATAEDATPLVSPDRIEDVPSTQADPFPAFDNFAWRAFVALNWPSLPDPADRGVPDRAKTLGDPGPRVWETFKSRYELFQVGPDGQPVAPQPWATYEALNPCGADVDNRAKTLASFDPFVDFNQSAFFPASPPIRWSRRIAPIRVTKCASTSPNTRRSRSAAGARARTCPTRPIPAHLPAGSIAVKAAWRLLTAADTPAIRARYYVVENAEVVDVAKTLAAGRSRLLEERRRARRPAHRDQDEIPAAGAVEHLRTCRQRAAGRRGRSARAGRQGRGRALFLFRRVETGPRPLAAIRLARHRSRSAWTIRPRSTLRRCRWCAGIRSIPRPWR